MEQSFLNLIFGMFCSKMNYNADHAVYDIGTDAVQELLLRQVNSHNGSCSRLILFRMF